MSFLKKHDVILKILSLLVAVFLWSYVVLTDDPPKTTRFSNIAVEMTGVDKLEERGLILVNESEPKIDVSVTGTTNNVVRLTAADISATVDFSDIQEASTYYMQPTVTVPKADSISYKPQRLQFKVENITTKEVPVHVTTMNSLAEGRLVGKLTPKQSEVTIRGAESVVSTVEYALLTVDLQDVSGNTAQTCRVTLYGEDDALIDSPYVAAEQQSMDVAVSLNHVVTVPLMVTLLPSAELSRDMVETQISPETVRVYGAKGDVDSLTSLSLGTIDLKDVQSDGQEFTLTIKLPAGIQLMDGESDSARVKLTMKDDVTRTVSVTDVTLTDTNTGEGRPEVTLETDSLDVQIKGKANVVSGVTAADIHAEATFDSAALGAGTHTVTVKVTVDKNGVTLVSEDLSVEIRVEEQEEAGDQS